MAAKLSALVANSVKGKNILVTGGTGSIGQELVRQLLELKPNVIRIYSRDETKQFEMAHRFRGHKNLRFFIGDVRDRDRVFRAMESIHSVFHLAALKHVITCEYNPFEAVKTNVSGTQNIIDAAIEVEVERVLFTSSDKAVNPSNTMGTSKLMAEKLITAANYYKGPRKSVFTSCRLGNVLGSRGSIIPLVAYQVQNGGPVTLTDPDMTRYVVDQSEVVRFLIESAAQSIGGEVLVQKMVMVKTPDLLDAIIGHVCAKIGKKASSIEIKHIGVRPGEKVYEELFTDEESLRTYQDGNRYVVVPQLAEVLEKAKFPVSKWRQVPRGPLSSQGGPFLGMKELARRVAGYLES